MSGLTNLVEKTGLEKENYTKQRNKCVKLRKSSIKTSLLNYVSFVPTCFTCLRSYVSYVPTCLCTLNYDVSTCPHFLPGYVPTCLCACKYNFCAFQSLWLKLFRAYVHSFFTCLNAYNHSQNILKFTSILGIGIFGLLFHLKTPEQTSASKAAYLNPTLWGFIIWTGACADPMIWGPSKKSSKTMDS